MSFRYGNVRYFLRHCDNEAECPTSAHPLFEKFSLRSNRHKGLTAVMRRCGIPSNFASPRSTWTAQSRLWPLDRNAAARPVIAAIRCDCKIRRQADSHYAGRSRRSLHARNQASCESNIWKEGRRVLIRCARREGPLSPRNASERLIANPPPLRLPADGWSLP